MRFSSFVAALAIPSLLSFAAIGCSAQSAETDEVWSNEDELSAACTLGTTCPEAFEVLGEKTLESVPADRTRDDVTVAFDGEPVVAEAFAHRISRKLVRGTARVVLTGSADGRAPVVVDDFLLVEVLAADGKVLRTGAVNPPDSLRVDGVAPTPLAPPAPWRGPRRGWAYHDVDVTELLPADGQTFRLRVSAFDFAGFAMVSDVYVKSTDAPPPTPVDVFDPASCQGPSMTRAEAIARFEPAASKTALGPLSVSVRARRCHAVTGCAAWWTTKALPYETFIQNPWGSQSRVVQRLDISDLDAEATKATLEIGGLVKGVPQISVVAAIETHKPRLRLAARSWEDVDGKRWTSSDPLPYVRRGVTVTDHCLRINGVTSLPVDTSKTSSTTEAPPSSGSYDQYEVVLFASY